MNFLLYREQLNTPLVLLCYHTSVGKASKVCEMFMTAMPVCPTVLVANVFSAGMKLIQFVSRYCFFVLLEHAARACLQGFSGW